MTVTFVGHGYVGLVTATVFADLGNTVYVIGHTPKKIENLKKGSIPIYEPGLEELVKRNIAKGRLIFTLDYTPAIPKSEVVFIAVGTPPLPTGEADLSVVLDVAEKVGRALKNYTVVITKSTVPIGTSTKVREIIERVKPKTAEFDYASVPEFLREGQAIADTFKPDRIVIGTDAKKAEEILVELHRPIATRETTQVPVVLTNIPTAEMIKYASNAFLATKISFANAIAHLSEHLGADGPKVLESIGLDKRIGSHFLNAGAGYGGSCFPKDVKAIIAIAEQNNYDFRLLKEVEHVNKQAIEAIILKAEKMLGQVKGATIAILGLSFKPDTDDMRDAPSLTVIRSLVEKGAKIQAYDPVATENAKLRLSDLSNIIYVKTALEAVKKADLAIIMTEWNEFKELNMQNVKKQMKHPRLIDGRNIYTPKKVKDAGFAYKGVGR